MLTDGLAGLVAVGTCERRVDVGDRSGHVVHPDRVGGLLDGRHETCPLRLRTPSRGDVLDGADHAYGTAGPVPDDLALLVDEPHLAVGPDDPVVEVVRGALADRRSLGRPHASAVFGVNDGEECLGGPGEPAALDPEDPVGLVGSARRVGRKVPVPAPDMGDPLGLGKGALAFAQRHLGGQALGDVPDVALETAVGELGKADLRRQARPVLAPVPPLDEEAGSGRGLGEAHVHVVGGQRVIVCAQARRERRQELIV